MRILLDELSQKNTFGILRVSPIWKREIASKIGRGINSKSQMMSYLRKLEDEEAARNFANLNLRLDCEQSAMVAMADNNCFIVGSFPSTAANFSRIHKLHNGLFVGFFGLISDMNAQKRYGDVLDHILEFEPLDAGVVSPLDLSHFVSAYLGDRDVPICNILIAGFDEGIPRIVTVDSSGNIIFAENYVVHGTSNSILHDACEGIINAEMLPEEMFQSVCNALKASIDQDNLNGYGGVVYLVNAADVKTKVLKRI